MAHKNPKKEAVKQRISVYFTESELSTIDKITAELGEYPHISASVFHSCGKKKGVC